MKHHCGNTNTRKTGKALKVIKQRSGKTDLYYKNYFDCSQNGLQR